MKTMYADFNAMTRPTVSASDTGLAGRHRHRCSELGDWVWLTDSELIVVRRSPRTSATELPSATPTGRRLVHLDDDDAADRCKVRAELQKLLTDPRRSVEQEGRIFELLTIFEMLARRRPRPIFLRSTSRRSALERWH